MDENPFPVAATVATVAAVPVILTLPWATLLVLAGLVAGVAMLAAGTMRPLAIGVSPRRAALRAAAATLVVIGGPLVAAVELGPGALPLLAAAGAAALLAVALLPGPWHRSPGRDRRGQDPANVCR